MGKLLNQLKNKELITAANTASCIWKIAKYKPQFRSIITEYLTKVDLTKRDPECTEILSGKALKSLEAYWPFIEVKKDVMDFVKRHSKSKRRGTQKKAELLKERYQKDIK